MFGNINGHTTSLTEHLLKWTLSHNGIAADHNMITPNLSVKSTCRGFIQALSFLQLAWHALSQPEVMALVCKYDQQNSCLTL